jgi:hypothetical protein
MTNKKNRPVRLGNPNSSKRFYSNSYTAQQSRMLKAFETKKQISTFDFRDNLGIVHPAGRIKELRKKHKILTSWTLEVDQNGVGHRIGLYTYHGLKNGQEA